MKTPSHRFRSNASARFLMLAGALVLSALPACAVFDSQGNNDDAHAPDANTDTLSQDSGKDALAADTASDIPDIDHRDAESPKCPTLCGAGACDASGHCIHPVEITAGLEHMCALMDDDSVRC